MTILLVQIVVILAFTKHFRAFHNPFHTFITIWQKFGSGRSKKNYQPAFGTSATRRIDALRASI